jgi:hypothetical protein
MQEQLDHNLFLRSERRTSYVLGLVFEAVQP